MAELEDQENHPVEESQSLRVMGGEDEAMDAQVKGMKDMFTALLVENRKEYDRQVTDMKQLFLSVIEDNRRTFDTKMQELYSDLPRIVERTISSKVPSEDFIYLNEGEGAEEQAARRDKVDKYTRLQAVTEIILGEDVRGLEDAIRVAQANMNKHLNEDKDRLGRIAGEISEALQSSSERINDSLNKLYDDLQSHFEAHDQKQAHTKLISAYMGELSDKVTE